MDKHKKDGSKGGGNYYRQHKTFAINKFTAFLKWFVKKGPGHNNYPYYGNALPKDLIHIQS